MKQESFYATTPIFYASGGPHIGHALAMVYTDTIARFARLQGKDVRFLTGTDEHGQKIARKAAEHQREPQAFVDEIAQMYHVLAKRLNISNTDFIRTTEPRHKLVVEAFWKRVAANGFIYKKSYTGLYCTGCEGFKTEKDLVDGKCPDHQRAPEQIEEENYFFQLSAFRERLLELFNTRPDFVIPEAKRNEMLQILESGLEDISISRSRAHLTWGIPVPGDDSQVVYVWFDALINYLTGAGFGSDEESYAKYWPVVTHVVGKEINRFHAILWPAMLMAADIPVPHTVAVHGWINVDGQKMSKTIGNVIEPDELMDTYGVDAMRYLLLAQIPFVSDGDWGRERSKQKYEADLANSLGNLVFRVTSMLEKYCESIVPSRTPGDHAAAWAEYAAEMESYHFDKALDVAWRVVRDANQFVDTEKPWALAKEGNRERLESVLYALLETCRNIAWMIRPHMPTTSDTMLTMLGFKEAQRDNAVLSDISTWGLLEPGTVVVKGEPLFPRLGEKG